MDIHGITVRVLWLYEYSERVRASIIRNTVPYRMMRANGFTVRYSYDTGLHSICLQGATSRRVSRH